MATTNRRSPLRPFLTPLVTLLLTSRLASAGDDVRIDREEGFALAATYFAAEPSGAAVLMLPQCNLDRHSYDGLGAALAAKGIHALAVDIRGFGDSIGGHVGSFIVEKKQHLERLPADVDAAAAWLRERSGATTRVAVIGSSCGATPALDMLYRDSAPSAAVFIATALPWLEDEIRTRLSFTSVPVLCIVARDDPSFRVTHSLFNNARNPQSQLRLYKGKVHGMLLQEQDPDFIATIVQWLATQLAAK